MSLPFASGGVSPMMLQQLAAWEDIARLWVTCQIFDVDEHAWVERCGDCMGGLYRTTDRFGKPYKWTDEQRLTMVVAHLRLCHLDLDPDRPVT